MLTSASADFAHHRSPDTSRAPSPTSSHSTSSPFLCTCTASSHVREGGNALEAQHFRPSRLCRSGHGLPPCKGQHVLTARGASVCGSAGHGRALRPCRPLRCSGARLGVIAGRLRGLVCEEAPEVVEVFVAPKFGRHHDGHAALAAWQHLEERDDSRYCPLLLFPISYQPSTEAGARSSPQ